MSGTIVIVGGGISGLAALHEIVSYDHEDVVLLEASDALGGKIRTSPFVDLPVDEGADAFLARVPDAIDLARELGLEGELISPARRNAFIWADGSLHPIPSPNVLGIPLTPEAAEGLLSDEAIAHIAADIERATPDPVLDDDTVGSLVRRRLGDEVFERLVNPLLGSINAGDLDQLSLQSVAPQIASAAATNPSLINGLLAQRGDVDPDAPVFHSFANGVGRLVDVLAMRYEPWIRREASVVEVARKRRNLRLTVNQTETINARAVIMATPAHVSAPLLGEWELASAALSEIEYVSVVLITMAFRRRDVEMVTDGSGFLVPRGESPLITACSWTSAKWDHLDDGEHLIVRVSLGSAGADAAISARDADLIGTARRDLSETMGISADPMSVRISRWSRSFPQYAVGHADRVDRIRTELGADRVHVAGAAFDGIGIPACIRSGRTAAQAALSSLA